MASCSLDETILFKESPPSIMSLGTLTGQQRLYGTGLVKQKGKMLSPPMRPFYSEKKGQAALLILSKIAKNLFLFFPFFILPFMFLTLASLNNSYEYFQFCIGKYRTNPKNTILLTLVLVNIFIKK